MTDALLTRYEMADALRQDRLAGLMRNRAIEPTWTGRGDELWYRRQSEVDGGADEYVLVDPETGVRKVVATLEELDLPPAPAAPEPGLLVGPGGRSLVRRGHDLWLLQDGTETQVTSDGEDGFAWGALPDNSNMFVPFQRMGLVLPPVGTVFSPSGRYALTIRVDQRSMRTKHLVENVAPDGSGRPVCHEYRVQLEDEGAPPPSECRVLDLTDGTHVDVDVTDGLTGGLVMNGASEVTWSADESRAYVLRHGPGASTAELVEVVAATGERRTLVTLDDGVGLYEANQFLYSLPLVHVLPETQEAVLFSQRDGWGHLYLYDLTTGECRHRITEGELVVRDILLVDAASRQITFVAGSAEGGHNPYWRKVHRASLDGGAQQLLTPEPADHELSAPQPQFFRLVFGQGKPEVSSISPSGRYFVDTRSTVSEPPVILLRDAQDGGRVVLELERTDVTRLLAAGYQVPQQFTVKADDGVTDLWGVLSLPADPVDPARIPVVDHLYGGFQTTWSPPSFLGGAKTTGAHAAFASYNALGFATLIVDGRGTPGRHRDFRQWTHKQFHTSRGLEDHVTAIKALAQEHPELDLENVGVIGHSYGGYNAARMLLMFPEFWKAGVSGAGVHDPRKTPYGLWDWHVGQDADRTSEEYLGLGNLHLADRLEGDLLIACGEIDENATVDHSFALVDALMKAGKRFDLKIWPGVDHYGQGPYILMSFWDHFVTSLLGQRPPKGYRPT